MTMEELITASAKSYSAAEFAPQERMKIMAMTAAVSEKPERAPGGRKFVLMVLAAVLALALSITAIAAASGAIRLPALERLFGLEPAAEVEDRDVLAPYIRRQVENWNWQRAEENRLGGSFELADPEVIENAYRAGVLDIDGIYAMFGMDAPTEDTINEAIAGFPELEKNERELRSGLERFKKLGERTEAGETLSSGDEAFVLKYTALEHETVAMRSELSATLWRMGRYEREPENWPKALPSEYRCGAPERELMGDREKIAALLADSRAGEGWQCWVLSMSGTGDGYKVEAAFAQLVQDEDGARLLDEDGVEVFTFEDGEGCALSDLEAESFMQSLPKWSVVLKKSVKEVTTSTGAVKHHWEDNSFAVTSMRRLSLINPKNQFLYKSTYEYVEPLGERDGRGALVQPFYPEKLETGECCLDETFLNTAALYDFVMEYQASGTPVLTVYTPDGTMTLDAACPEELSVTNTVWDFDSGAVTATAAHPTDFTIEDDVFIIHYGERTEEYPMEYPLPLWW